MIRMAGIVLGMLLMLAIFLRVLHPGNDPRPASSTPVSGGEIPLQAGRRAPAITGELPPHRAEENAGSPDAIPWQIDPDPADVPGGTADGTALVLNPQHWNQALGAAGIAPGHDPDAPTPYPLWTPFRSQWAAEGFAQRLTRATDVPVEVVKTSPDGYQVVFRYRDEGERRSRIRQIETVTGLELEP